MPDTNPAAVALRDDDSSAQTRSLAGEALVRHRWSRTPYADRPAATAAARQAMWQRWLDTVDPLRELPEDERNHLAAEARRAHMQALVLARTRKR